MHSLDENIGKQGSATQQNAGSQNPASPTGDEEDSQSKSFFGIIIHSFFVVPFLIAVFGVLLFAAVRLLTLEQHTIYDYINDVKTGSLSKRWQSAFELSKALSNPKLVPTDERFISELISAFEHSKHDDDRVRQYLALAMGRVGNPVFVKPLTASLQDEKSENLYAIIYALGILKDKSAAGALRPYLDSPDARLRLAAVIALGDIAETNSIGPLKKALYDSEPNVQWDAAIALAKMRNPSGKDTLLKLLDRDYLSKFPEVDSEERKHILLVAINAAAMLDDAEINVAIQSLVDSDQNMEVRKTALAVIKKWSPTGKSVVP